MSFTGVKLGKDAAVRLGYGVTPAFLVLTGLGDFSNPDQPSADVDVTSHSSPGRTEEAIPGLMPVAEWTVSKDYIQGTAEDEKLEELRLSGETIQLEITPPGGTARTWAAYVKSYVPTFPVKSQMKADLKLVVMAEIIA